MWIALTFRDEFKRHKNAQENFVPPFMREWQKYEALLSQKQDRVRCGS